MLGDVVSVVVLDLLVERSVGESACLHCGMEVFERGVEIVHGLLGRVVLRGWHG